MTPTDTLHPEETLSTLSLGLIALAAILLAWGIVRSAAGATIDWFRA